MRFASSSRWSALALVLSGVALLPLRHPFPPITDFPEHAATIATVLDLWRSGPLAGFYETDFLHTQYWLMAVLGALLAPLVGGPVAALKTLLVLSTVGTAAAITRVARALDLDERLALLSAPLVWTRPFSLGFVPFLLAAPLVLLAVTEVCALRRPTRARHLVVTLLGLAVFFLNLTSLVWLFAMGAAGALVLERGSPTLALRRCLGLVALVLPVGGWTLTSAVTHVDESRFAVPMFAVWRPLKVFFRELPQWLTDRWSGEVDLLVLGLVGVGLVVSALPVGTREPSWGRKVVSAWLLATVALVFALPFQRGWLWGLSWRFLPFVLLLLPFSLARFTGPLRLAALGCFTVAGLLAAWDAERHTVAAQDELAGLEVLRGLPTGSRLRQFTFDESSAVANDTLVSHAGAYHRVWNLGPNEPSFVDLPQSVVRYLPGKEPFRRAWTWSDDPLQFDEAREGPSYDAVLVRGDGPFPPPGSTWVLRRRSGAWSVWTR